jgi:hypothetical protein
MRSVLTLAGKLVGRIFTAHAERAPVARVILWWEYRRLPYNVIVGAAGLLTTTAMITTAFVCSSGGGEPIGLPDPPILLPLGIIAFGIFANVFYTGGWIAELLTARIWGVDAAPFGPAAFALGTFFSVLLAIAPGALVVPFAVLTSCRGF